MDKTIVTDRSVNNSSSNNNYNHTPVSRVISTIRQIISTGDASDDPPGPTEPTQDDRSKRLIRLKRTAENLDEIEKSLIRRIGATHTTDRATDKLICQLQIQTNRLLAQVGEFIDESRD